MKKGLKSFLKYVLFSGFLSVSAVASPIASPGTSTVYNGINLNLLYSPTVTNVGNNCRFILLVNQNTPGAYANTIDLSDFANCGSNAILVIKAAGGKGGGTYGGTGGITTLRIPLLDFMQKYGSQVTFYYLVNMGGTPYSFYGYGSGGESLVSLYNWPWNGGIPLAIGGGGGGEGGFTIFGVNNGYDWYGGGDGGGGNDCGYHGGGFGGGGGCGGWGATNGWYSPGGYFWYGGGGGGAGYGSGWVGGSWYGQDIYGIGGYGSGGGGGGGYCNTSLGICQASDWQNNAGNNGPGYVEIYIEDNVKTLS